MPAASVVPAEPPCVAVEEDAAPLAEVLPFSRLHLRNGARDGLVDRLGAYPGGSPVYLPDDPRLK